MYLGVKSGAKGGEEQHEQYGSGGLKSGWAHHYRKREGSTCVHTHQRGKSVENNRRTGTEKERS